MTAFAEAIDAAAAALAAERAVRDALPPSEAARRAYTPGGPTVTEITALVRAQRAEIRARRVA